jgi:class 3 adenylate cyclase
MLDVEKVLKARRTVVMFFAFISGFTAVSTAVLPAVLHV